MNLLDDDHAANPIGQGRLVIAVFESHDNGIPCTILTEGWAYDLWSFHTIDILGVDARAE